MKSELIFQMWQLHLNSIRPTFDRLTADNRQKRLTPDTVSYGFNALHTVETMILLGNSVLGSQLNVPFSTYRANDEGREIDPTAVKRMFDEGVASIAEAISQLPDEAWDETIQTMIGSIPRLQGFLFLMHHNSHHVGQMVQTNKKGILPATEFI